MIVVTGGSGFIGSALVWALNRRGEDDILIVDQLRETEKWKNLVGLRFNDYLDKSVFIDQLTRGHFGDRIRAILHMGACSATTENNADYLMENNYRYTARIAAWRETQPRCRLIYASSAATYGDGARGYSDNEAELLNLRPLNMYGYSKHLFDLLALRKGWLKHIVGLKYFNVFGPNEYHKDDMRSVINKAFPQVRNEGPDPAFQVPPTGLPGRRAAARFYLRQGCGRDDPVLSGESRHRRDIQYSVPAGRSPGMMSRRACSKQPVNR
jgi:ADP-L-glycero-D-manno-heptose 6-epimerase